MPSAFPLRHVSADHRGVLLLCLALLPLTPYAFSSIQNFSIPFITYGPAFSNPAAVARVNASVYGGRLPPLPLDTLPVLRIAGSICTTGAYDGYGELQQVTLSFMVDMVNAKGGLDYNGTTHLLAVTWASDDSSADYLRVLYSIWLNDPWYAMYFLPPSSAQQLTLAPLVQGTRKTFTSVLTTEPGELPLYPYTFNMIGPWDIAPLETLTTIDARARLYHEEVMNGTVTIAADTVSNAYGVLTICLYAHNDTATIAQCSGVRSWINSTNAGRSSAGALSTDLISVLVDVIWDLDASASDASLYQAGFDQCPDGVDLVVVCSESTDTDMTAVTQAMAASRLHPKAAYSTSSALAYDPTNPTMLLTWQYWTTQSDAPVAAATLPMATFETVDEFAGVWLTYFGTSLLPNVGEALLSSMIDVIKAVLYRTTSLNSSDLRAAFLSLNGSTFAENIRFDPLTGLNPALTVPPHQLQATGTVLIQSLNQLIYPAPFPWARDVPGDALISSQSGVTIVVAFVMAVLGCWVAQIILEQAIYVRREGGWYQLWLLADALSLGGAGVWCAQWTMSAGLSVQLHNSTAVLYMEWAVLLAMLALLPAVLLTWTGLMVIMQDMEHRNKAKVTVTARAEIAARDVRRREQEERRKRAGLSITRHMLHLKDSTSWYVGIGSLLVAAGVCLSRVSLFSVWSVQATVTPSVVGWTISVLVTTPLIASAMLIYFHGLRNRVVAVFLLAGAIMIDWQVQVAFATYKYAALLVEPSAVLNALLVSSEAVTLVCGIVAAVTCLGFVGLQFSRMQLSRNGLSALVASMENAIRKQRNAFEEVENELLGARQQVDALARLVQCINLTRPIHKEFIFAIAAHSNISTLVSLCTHYDVTTQGTFPMSRVEDGNLASSELHIKSSSVTSIRRFLPHHLSGPFNPDSASCPTDTAMPEAEVAAEKSVKSPGKKLSVMVYAERDDSAAPNHGQVQLGRSQDSGDQRAKIMPQDPSTQQSVFTDQVERSEQVADAVQDRLSIQINHAERSMKYESNLLATLTGYKSLHAFTSSQGSRSDSVSSISLAHSEFQSPDRRPTFASPRDGDEATVPTLSALLQHPACVEVIKDELQRLHSVENLCFFLLAARYRRLQSSKVRRQLALHIVDTFIADTAEEQINLSTRHRDHILAAVRSKKDDACGAGLFVEAEKEVLMLMETNLNSFQGSRAHRLCVWLYRTVDMKEVLALTSDQYDIKASSDVGRSRTRGSSRVPQLSLNQLEQ